MSIFNRNKRIGDKQGIPSYVLGLTSQLNDEVTFGTNIYQATTDFVNVDFAAELAAGKWVIISGGGGGGGGDNGIFGVPNNGGTVPTTFAYSLTDSIQQNASNSYIKHSGNEFLMTGTALSSSSYIISRSLANTIGSGSAYILNNSGLTNSDRIDIFLSNRSSGVSSTTNFLISRKNINGALPDFVSFIAQEGSTQNLYFNYSKGGTAAYGDVVVSNGDFRINENLVYEATAAALADAIKLTQSPVLGSLASNVTWDGTFGGLFSITDDKDNQLFGVADVSGNNIMYADADWLIQLGNPFSVPFELNYNSTTGATTTILNNTTVAIGHSSPTEALDVVGSIKMVDGNQGFGKVMTSDANGVSSWTPISIGNYAQTANSATVTGTTEVSIVGTGVGSLSIPANAFVVGDSFHAKIGGKIGDTGNGDRIIVRIKTGATILATTGSFVLDSTQAISAGGEGWECELDFTIAAIGATGTICTNGNFAYTKTNDKKVQGYVFQDVQPIDTTVSNTLDITIEWGQINTDIFSANFVLYKVY